VGHLVEFKIIYIETDICTRVTSFLIFIIKYIPKLNQKELFKWMDLPRRRMANAIKDRGSNFILIINLQSRTTFFLLIMSYFTIKTYAVFIVNLVLRPLKDKPEGNLL